MASEVKACSETVRGPGRWGWLHQQPCKRPAKVDREGNAFCGIHDPEAVKARAVAAQAKYDAKWKAKRTAREATAALQSARDAVVESARKLGPRLDSYLAVLVLYPTLPPDEKYLAELNKFRDALAALEAAERAGG